MLNVLRNQRHRRILGPGQPEFHSVGREQAKRSSGNELPRDIRLPELRGACSRPTGIALQLASALLTRILIRRCFGIAVWAIQIRMAPLEFS